MKTQLKHNGNIKMSLLQILLKSTLVVGLGACNSSAIQFSNLNAKEDKSMIDEIFNSDIKSDNFLTIQKDRIDVNTIVLKYFQIGESKQEIVSKLHQMGAGVREEANGKIVKTGKKKSGIYGGDMFAQILNITFEFDQSEKLVSVKSMYFTQQ